MRPEAVIVACGVGMVAVAGLNVEASRLPSTEVSHRLLQSTSATCFREGCEGAWTPCSADCTQTYNITCESAAPSKCADQPEMTRIGNWWDDSCGCQSFPFSGFLSALVVLMSAVALVWSSFKRDQGPDGEHQPLRLTAEDRSKLREYPNFAPPPPEGIEVRPRFDEWKYHVGGFSMAFAVLGCVSAIWPIASGER